MFFFFFFFFFFSEIFQCLEVKCFYIFEKACFCNKNRNKIVILKQGYRYQIYVKNKFYRRHSELMTKYNVGLTTLQQDRFLEVEFYGDFVFKFRKLVCKTFFNEETNVTRKKTNKKIKKNNKIK